MFSANVKFAKLLKLLRRYLPWPLGVSYLARASYAAVGGKESGGNCSFMPNLANPANCQLLTRLFPSELLSSTTSECKEGGTVRWRRAMTEEFDEDVVFEVRITAAYVSQTCL